MTPDQAFSDLIGRIYDCALDTSRWPEALGEIVGLLRGELGDLTVIHPLTGTFKVAALHNWSDDLLRRMQENMPINPAAPLVLTAAIDEPMCTSRDLDIEAFHNSRYWKQSFGDTDYYDYLTAVISRTPTSGGVWGVFGHVERGPFSDADLQLARMISPHIRRSVEISGVLGHERVQAGTLRAALDALAAAALIVEPQGVIRFRNNQAERELSRGDIIREHQGRLVGMTGEASRLLATVTAAKPRNARRGLDALLSSDAGRELHVTWAEVERVGEELGSPTLILLREPEATLNTPLSSAARLYRLTNAECQVLAQVLKGQSLQEIAEILGVARSTVKSHLESLYRKTETRRQAELVRSVMSLSSLLTA
ncbi:MAG TPA: LuxR C-terminal-related transcriptional regulator [Beijerinckiaceae bacterium]|jgi:DNA-binding CsgD family transcriptional regulator/PAS domain-containing protein